MLGPISLVDILFVITIILLVFNGLRNGFVFSLINLLSLPIGFAVAWFFGPQLVQLLAANGLNATPIIAYVLLFFAAVLVVHIVATFLSGIIKKIPIVNLGDALLGGFIGFVEAWLLWVVLLLVLAYFLQHMNLVPGIRASQFSGWQQFYNDTISNSLFARVNSFIVPRIPVIKISLLSFF